MECRPTTSRPDTTRLPILYAITDVLIAGMPHPEIVRQLLAGRCRLIQIRNKELPDYQFLPQLIECVTLCRQAGAIVLVNDRPDLAAYAQTDGVHLGQEDMPPQLARRFLGPSFLIGRSTHNLEQALEAEQDPDVDYIAVGPLFPTRTKVTENPVLGIAGLEKIRSCIRKPLVSIGGINLQNAAEALAAGADSVAVISDLMAPAPISHRVESFQSLLQTMKSPSS